MKRIILLVVLLMIPFNVSAKSSSFYEDIYLPDAYIKKFKENSTTGKYEQMKMFKRNDGMFSYCIELWETVNSNVFLSEYSSNDSNITGLTDAVYNRINLIAYYGYGFLDHTDLSWYTASQYMIWKTVEPTSTIYFTDTLNGVKSDKFLYEINEIERLISNHYVMPSFNNFEFELGKNYSLNDNNNVLNNYNKYGSGDILIDSYINGNELRIIPKEVGVGSFELYKYDNTPTYLYVRSGSQNMLVRGGFPRISKQYTYSVTGGLFEVSLVDEETNSFISGNKYDMSNSKFGLYDLNNNLIDEKYVNNRGKLSFKRVPFGEYYIKQLSFGNGYEKDNNIYKVECNSNFQNKNTVIKNKKIRGNLIINNFYFEDGKKNNIDGNIFEIYDLDNNLVGSITTDINGYGSISLDYGTYYVIQIQCLIDHKSSELFYIDILDSSDKRLDIENEKYNHNITFINSDYDSTNIISYDESSYKIKSLIDNAYVSVNGKDIFNTKNGSFDINLNNGKYRIENYKEINGYYRSEDYEFEIFGQDYSDITFNLLHKKIKGDLEIDFLGELNDEYIGLEGVKVQIYSENDIIGKDGILYYKKDELIGEYESNTNGIVEANKLLIGKYYIKFSYDNDKYIVDSNKYYFYIRDNSKVNLSFKMFLKKGMVTITDNSSGSYKLYDSNDQLVGEYKTFDGNISIYNLIKDRYYIIQDSVSDNFIVDYIKRKFEITDNNDFVSINYNNEKEIISDEKNFIEKKDINVLGADNSDIYNLNKESIVAVTDKTAEPINECVCKPERYSNNICDNEKDKKIDIRMMGIYILEVVLIIYLIKKQINQND